ncbi:caspase recruitment domain-containing protein 19 isoform 4-T6 [Molossus nigricans]
MTALPAPHPPAPVCTGKQDTLPQVEQTYCDRLVQDTPFLMGHGRLSEQQVDRIILQLNRYYPQILSNKDAEKVRGQPDVSFLFLPPGVETVGGRRAWTGKPVSLGSGTPKRPCVCGCATSWATCSGAASGTARSSTALCTSTPSPCTAACPAGGPHDPWPSWPVSAWLRGWPCSCTAALQTPRCCQGPGVCWASPHSSWTGTPAASCWPS